MSTKSESNIFTIWDIFKVEICLEAPGGKLTSKSRWVEGWKEGENCFSHFSGGTKRGNWLFIPFLVGEKSMLVAMLGGGTPLCSPILLGSHCYILIYQHSKVCSPLYLSEPTPSLGCSFFLHHSMQRGINLLVFGPPPNRATSSNWKWKFSDLSLIFLAIQISD